MYIASLIEKSFKNNLRDSFSLKLFNYFDSDSKISDRASFIKALQYEDFNLVINKNSDLIENEAVQKIETKKDQDIFYLLENLAEESKNQIVDNKSILKILLSDYKNNKNVDVFNYYYSCTKTYISMLEKRGLTLAIESFKSAASINEEDFSEDEKDSLDWNQYVFNSVRNGVFIACHANIEELKLMLKDISEFYTLVKLYSVFKDNGTLKFWSLLLFMHHCKLGGPPLNGFKIIIGLMKYGEAGRQMRRQLYSSGFIYREGCLKVFFDSFLKDLDSVRNIIC